MKSFMLIFLLSLNLQAASLEEVVSVGVGLIGKNPSVETVITIDSEVGQINEVIKASVEKVCVSSQIYNTGYEGQNLSDVIQIAKNEQCSKQHALSVRPYGCFSVYSNGDMRYSASWPALVTSIGSRYKVNSIPEFIVLRYRHDSNNRNLTKDEVVYCD